LQKRIWNSKICDELDLDEIEKTSSLLEKTTVDIVNTIENLMGGKKKSRQKGATAKSKSKEPATQ
ncbi:hypothetical protein NL533_33860, partial [Klebsiella pneumoniae]|nr:hypothetical protein [Klebsiella pneumoniae]